MPQIRRRVLRCHSATTASSTAAGRSTTPSSGAAPTCEGHIPGAAFLDVERDLSAPPGPRGPASAARRRRASPRRRAAPGIGAGDVRRRLRLARRRRAAVVAAAAFRPRRAARCSTSTPGTDRSTPASEETTPAAVFEPRARDDDTIDARRARASGSASSSSSTRACRRAGAASRTRSTACPGGSRAPSTRPGTSRCPALPAGELVAYCGSGVTACVVAAPAAPRRPRRAALPGLVVGVGAAARAAARRLSRG